MFFIFFSPHFFKYNFNQPHIGTFGFATTQKANASQNQKSQLPAHPKTAVVV